MSNFKNNFAVVIGINQYENNIPELKTAVNDAKQIAKILENEHKYKVLLLTDKQATYTELSNLLASLQQQILPLSDGSKVQLDKDDRLLFYFAGHGIGLNADDGVERPEGLLVPQDATNLNENKNLLSMQLLHDTLVSLHTRHLLIIFDCCFAGSFRWTGKSRHVRPKRQIVRERYERYLKGNAKQVITSTAHDEKATDQSRFGKRDETEINGHSPFAQLLLDGLKGQADLTQDGVITTYELYSYLQSELVNKPTSTKQTPLIFTLAGHDIGDYIFLLASFDPDKLPRAIALDQSTNPYRGLKSFEKENEEFFFGRNELIKNLAEIVETHPLTVVLGSSGSGKSSLVKAGLVPYLEKPENVTHPWNILLPLRLGNSPFKALDNLLKQRQGLPLTQLTQPPQPQQQKTFQIWDDILATLKIKQKNLTTPNVSHQVSEPEAKEIFNRLETELNNLIHKNIGEKLLLVIDQFEELITQCPDDERCQFLKLLHDVLSKYQSQLRIVITLRSEFEPQFSETNLKPFWQDSARFQVTKMNREQLREIIEEPAAKQVIFFESPKLIDKLVDEAVNMPGGLSLLSFALSEQYLMYLKSETEGKRNDRTIAEEDYKNLGGVTRSLIQTADKLYDELVNKDNSYEQIIRHVMLRMVTSSGGELARRRVLKSELKYSDTIQQQVDDVIESFLDARLLVSDKDADNQPYVEPAHDELVLGWPKLRDWVAKDKEQIQNLILQRRLTPAAIDWQKSNKQIAYLWNADPYLDVLKKNVLNSPDNNWLNQLETEFVQRSIWQRRRNTNLRWSFAISVILGLSGLTIWALREQRNAVIGLMNTARESSEAGLRSNNLTLDTLIQSLRAAKSRKHWLLQVEPPDKQLQEQVTTTLRKALYLNREQKRWQLPPDEVAQDTFVSQDGKLLLATTNNKRTICVWDLESSRQCQELPKDIDLVTKAKFSPDGKKLVIMSENFAGVYLWNWENQQFVRLSGLPGTVESVSFSPDSRALAFISRNQDWQHFAYWWNWENQQLDPLTKIPGEIQAISFKPDGNLLVAATTTRDNNKALHLWDYRSGTRLGVFPVESPPVDFAIISPNCQSLVMTSGSGRTRGTTSQLWHLKKDTSICTNEKDTPTELGHISDVSYSSDGQQLASADADGTIRLFYFGNQWSELKGHQGLVYSFSFSSNGKQLLTVANDNTIRLWNIDTERGSQELSQNQLPNPVHNVSFSPDSKQLATLEEGKIFLRNVSSGQHKEFSQRKYNSESQLIFHPKGKQLAIVEPNGELNVIHLLDLSSGQESPLPGQYRSVSSLSFSPDGKQLAIFEDVTIRDGKSTLHVLDLASKQERKFDWNKESLESATWKSDANGKKQLLVAIAGVDQTSGVEIWDYFENKRLASLPYGRSSLRFVKNISFNNDGSLVAINIGQSINLWDRQSNQSVDFELGSKETNADDNTNEIKFSKISPDGSVIATIDENGQAILWQLEGLDELLERGCNWVRDYLENNPNVNESDRHLCDGINQPRKSLNKRRLQVATPPPTPMTPLQAIPEDYYDRGQEQGREDLIRKKPNNVNDYINRGVAYYRLRKKYSDQNYIERAIKDYDNALKMSPKKEQAANALVNRGIAYSTRNNPGDQERAIADYNEVINRINPNYGDAYISRGIAYSAQGKHDLAIDDYQKAISLNRNDANAHYAKGFTLKLQGKKQDAIQAYQQAEALYRKQGKEFYR